MVMPGDNLKVTVKLITRIAMEEKLRLAIRGGGRTVGSGVVGKKSSNSDYNDCVKLTLVSFT